MMKRSSKCDYLYYDDVCARECASSIFSKLCFLDLFLRSAVLGFRRFGLLACLRVGKGPFVFKLVYFFRNKEGEIECF